MKRWQVLARHKWVAGAVITESLDVTSESDASVRRFTATIRGFRNWHIWRGATAYQPMSPRVQEIIRRVTAIRDRIDAGDETVFHEPGAW